MATASEIENNLDNTIRRKHDLFLGFDGKEETKNQAVKTATKTRASIICKSEWQEKRNDWSPNKLVDRTQNGAKFAR